MKTRSSKPGKAQASVGAKRCASAALAPAKTARGPEKGNRGSQKRIRETLQAYIEKEPVMPSVRRLLADLERAAGIEELTQLELRKLCLKIIDSESDIDPGGTLNRELAIIGSYLVSLILALQSILAEHHQKQPHEEADEHAEQALLMAELLRAWSRCLAPLEKNLDRHFGGQEIHRLTGALGQRVLGLNHPLLVAGHLADELPQSKFSRTDQTAIKAYAAALVEAMVIAGGLKKWSRLQAATAVAGALTKGGFEMPGGTKGGAKISPDTVKRWPSRMKIPSRKGDPLASVNFMMFQTFLRYLVNEVREDRTEDNLKILTARCRWHQGRTLRGSKRKT